MTNIVSDYVRVGEAARILAVSEQTIRKMVKDGTLKSIRIGSRGIRIPRDAVENFTGTVISVEPSRILTAREFLNPIGS